MLLKNSPIEVTKMYRRLVLTKLLLACKLLILASIPKMNAILNYAKSLTPPNAQRLDPIRKPKLQYLWRFALGAKTTNQFLACISRRAYPNIKAFLLPRQPERNESCTPDRWKYDKLTPCKQDSANISNRERQGKRGDVSLCETQPDTI